MAKDFEISFNSKAFNAQVKDLTKAYAELPARLQKKTVKRAMQQFVKQNKLTAVFRSHVPIGDDTNTWEGSRYKPGGMRKSVGYKTYWYRRAKSWVGKVGLMRSKTKRGYYGIMNDRGTVERFVGAGLNRRNGKVTSKAKNAYKAGRLRSVGNIAPKPFAAKAERATLSAGRSSFIKHMLEALEYVTRAIPRKPSKRTGKG